MENKSEVYEKVLNHIPMIFCVLDRYGKIIFGNKTYLDTIGDSKEQMSSRNFVEDAKTGRLDRSVTQMVYETKKEVTIMNTIRLENGKIYRILGSTTPILDKDGEVEYLVIAGMRLDTLRNDYMNAWLEDNARSLGMDVELAGPEKEPILYKSKSMEKMMELARRVAGVDVTVLITGESGTGKGALARYIHSVSSRKDKELVEVNCAAVPEALLESELFGYEKGAFTGALQTGKPGLLEVAQGGTLFLDEINSMPLALQGKLLKALEDKQIQRVGALKPQPVDFRLICASNSDLEAAVAAGTFRQDLYYRICVLPIRIPPLRERPEDILLLSKHFLTQYLQQYDTPKVLSPEGYQKLLAYDWPGNVRELKNVLERMVLVSDSSLVEVSAFPTLEADVAQNDFSLKTALDTYEKIILEEVLQRHGLTEAAAMLKINPSTLTRKRQKYGI